MNVRPSGVRAGPAGRRSLRADGGSQAVGAAARGLPDRGRRRRSTRPGPLQELSPAARGAGGGDPPQPRPPVGGPVDRVLRGLGDPLHRGAARHKPRPGDGPARAATRRRQHDQLPPAQGHARTDRATGRRRHRLGMPRASSSSGALAPAPSARPGRSAVPPTAPTPPARARLQQAELLVGLLTGTPAGGYADLRSAPGADATGSAFDEYHHRFDVRRARARSAGTGSEARTVPVALPEHRGRPGDARSRSPAARRALSRSIPTGRQIALWQADDRPPDGYGERWRAAGRVAGSRTDRSARLRRDPALAPSPAAARRVAGPERESVARSRCRSSPLAAACRWPRTDRGGVDRRRAPQARSARRRDRARSRSATTTGCAR